eukprot:4579445-Alexandrium_andersonii.AAC.1
MSAPRHLRLPQCSHSERFPKECPNAVCAVVCAALGVRLREVLAHSCLAPRSARAHCATAGKVAASALGETQDGS